MSDAFELCVGHFHFMLDIFLFFKYKDTGLSYLWQNSGHFDIPRLLAPLGYLTMCRTFCPTF